MIQTNLRSIISTIILRTAIAQIIPTKNGYLMKSPDPNLMKTIRDKCSFEIFKKH